MTFSKLGTDRETGQLVYLPKAARVQGLYIVGLQGMGKSGLISNLVMQDIDQQIGVCVLDPKRDLIDNIMARLPSDREKDVILLDVADEDYPFGLNLFECPNLNSPSQVEKTVDRVVHIFDKLLGVDEHTPLISQYLLHCTHTLVANPGYTMADIPLLLNNKNCRQTLVANVKKSQTRDFWHEYYDPMPLSDQRRERIFILRRVEKFLQDITLPIVGQSVSTIDMQKIMDEGKILLVKLERQMEQVTTIIGSILVALILNASASRKTQRQFHLYADEFQRFATEDFATLLEEARYAAIGITMAHQNRAQLEASDKRVEEKLKDRTLNVGSIVVFYVPTDAKELAGQFDTTSPPAWEEELEEESVEVLEEEWFEKVEEEVIDGTEPILTIKQGDIIQHLDRKGHANKRVVELFRKYIAPLLSGGYRAYQYYPDEPLDTFLVAGMHGRFLNTSPDLQDSVFAIVRAASVSKMESLFLGKYLQFVRHGDSAMQVLLEEYPTDTDIQNAVNTFIASYCVNPGQQRGFFPANAIKTLQEVFYLELLQLFFNWALPDNKPYGTDKPSYIDFSCINMTPSEQQWYQDKLIRDAEDKKEIDPIYTAHLLSEYDEKLKREYEQIHVRQMNNARHRILTFYRNSLYDTALYAQQRRQVARQLAQYMVTRLQDFILGITELAFELSKPENQIKENSGLQQPRKRIQINYHTHPARTITHPRVAITHPQPTSAEMEKKNENQLLQLDLYQAWVKMKKIDPQNPGKKCMKCGLRNANGARSCIDCNTKLPAPNEYIIETLAPEKGLYGKVLQARIERIKENNRKPDQFGHVYCRSRHDVEAEIVQRQSDCSGGSAPAQQLPQPSPQQLPHARQVPTCPKCGKSNPRGSQFCNQCGTKLT